jgi:RNA polymerase sigma factor (sigma-70 family)
MTGGRAPSTMWCMSATGPGSSALSRARERQLVLCAQAPDDGACEAVVEAFQPLIGGLARRYGASTSVTREELMQAGALGLLRALSRYDASLGTPFWAYASWWVRHAMQRLVSELAGPLVLSDRAIRELARLKAVEREVERERDGDATPRQLADRTGLGRAHVEGLIAARRPSRGLEEPAGGERGGALVDHLTDVAAEDAYDRVERRIDARSLLGAIARQLDERERIVVEARYGFDGPEQTLAAIGRVLGVTAERVRQIERDALDKLREAEGELAPAG